MWHDLDLITFLFYYHDTGYMTVDRAEMDKKLFAALKPGGFLVIADDSALPGQGVWSTGRCIVSRKSTLRQEVEAAGFQFRRRRQFLAKPRRHPRLPELQADLPVDNFVLKFQKPN